jgi:hypothetical protein
MWPPQCSKYFFPWGVSWDLERGSSPKGTNQVSRPRFQNFKVKICQFLVLNGSLVKSAIVLKKQDSFWKLVLMFGDQLLLQFVEKCNVVLCHDGSTLFQIVYKQNSLSQSTDTNTLFDDFCVLNFFGCRKPQCLKSLDCCLVSGSYIWIQVSIIVTRQLKNPTGYRRNWSKMACEASTLRMASTFSRTVELVSQNVYCLQCSNVLFQTQQPSSWLWSMKGGYHLM